MLNYFVDATVIIIIFTGIFVLLFGDWKKFTLKFAGVALSTVAAIFLIFLNITQSVPMACTDEPFCLNYSIYAIVRNVAFIIFHVTCGRDAIRFRRCERRDCKIAPIERRAA